MKVWLQKDWFDETGSLLRKSNNPHEIDDDRLAVLPSSALVGERARGGVPVSKLRNEAPPPVNPLQAENDALRAKIAELEAKAATPVASDEVPDTPPAPPKEPVGLKLKDK